MPDALSADRHIDTGDPLRPGALDVAAGFRLGMVALGFIPVLHVVLTLLPVALALTGRADAQVINGNSWPAPRLSVLTPCGGKVGTTFEIGFTGADLSDPESLWFSHSGIKATPIIPPDPKPDPKDPKKTPPKRVAVRKRG